MARKLKYRWERTWPDKPYDFACYDEAELIGRVFRHDHGPTLIWLWSMSIDRAGYIRTANGSAVDKIAACEALEVAYERAIGNG